MLTKTFSNNLKNIEDTSRPRKLEKKKKRKLGKTSSTRKTNNNQDNNCHKPKRTR